MSVAGDFFTTMGIAILAGRPIEARDTSAGIRAAVVNETMARTLFGERRPIGRQFKLSARPGAPAYEVVGIAADARYSNLRRPQPSIAYLSLGENPSPGSITFYARTSAAAPGLGAALEHAMYRVDPALRCSDADAGRADRALHRTGSLFRFARIAARRACARMHRPVWELLTGHAPHPKLGGGCRSARRPLAASS